MEPVIRESFMMVQVPLLAGSWEERSPSVGGGSGRSLTPWLQLGTAGGFVNRLPQHPGDLQRLLSPFRPVTLRSTGGRRLGSRVTLGQIRDLRLRIYVPNVLVFMAKLREALIP